MKDVYKTLVYVFSLITFLVLLSWFWYSKGQKAVTREWEKEKTQWDKILEAEQTKYKALFESHRIFSAQVADILTQKDKEYEDSIIAIRTDFTGRMRNHETRMQMYKRQAEAGSAQCSSLASHAAELDGSLEHGKRVAAELAATVRLRDEQLKLLGQQIQTDRAVLESN